VLASGWLTTGREVIAFEREIADMVGAAEGVAVSSCTAAIELSLRALHLPPGAPVLISTMTFCGAVHAIIHAGLRPVLVDIDEETLTPTPDTTRKAARLGAAAMVVTHVAGLPAQVGELTEAAGLTSDRVIEDAAHALGTSVGKRPVGAISRATCFSFYATKNLPIGEGGMVTTDDAEFANDVRIMRLHGMNIDAWRRYGQGGSWRYAVESPGLKANMTDVQAAIGRAGLARFPEWQARRESLAGRYRRNLSGLGGLELPPEAADGTHAWHLFILQVTPAFGLARDGFIAALADRGVDCSVHFIPVHHHPYFRAFLGAQDLPVADAVFERIVSLPLYPSLKDTDVDFVCDQIADLRSPLLVSGVDR
jgi:perosamine synthetase